MYSLELVEEDQRTDMAIEFFGKVEDFLLYESAVYRLMTDATKGLYTGGYWDYYRLVLDKGDGDRVNVAFVMLFDGEKDEVVPLFSPQNYCDETTTWRGASYAVNTIMINNLCHFVYNDQDRDSDEREVLWNKHANAFHHLRDSADSSLKLLTKDEAMALYSFID